MYQVTYHAYFIIWCFFADMMNIVYYNDGWKNATEFEYNSEFI